MFVPQKPEMSRTAGTAEKVDAEGKSRNCRELLRKLMQRAEAGTVGKTDAEGRHWNCQELLELPELSGKLTQRAKDADAVPRG